MLRYIHYNNKYLKKEGMSKKIIASGFFGQIILNTYKIL